jgi:polar amino acid transport system substrate-binding protein
MKRIWIFGIGIALCISLTFPTAEARTLADIIKAGELAVGSKADQPPTGGLDAQGRIVGWEPDLARKVAEYLFGDANKVRFVAVVAGNRIPFLQSGKIDICWATMAYTPERAKQIDFSIPYFAAGSLLLVKKDSPIKEIEDLKGKTTIVTKGSTQAIWLEKQLPDAHYIKFDTNSEAMQALRDGRGVAFAKDDSLLWAIAEQNSQYKVVGRSYMDEIWEVGFRKDEEDIKAFVNLAISHMYHTGFISYSLDKWWKGNYVDYMKKQTKGIFEKNLPESYKAK